MAVASPTKLSMVAPNAVEVVLDGGDLEGGGKPVLAPPPSRWPCCRARLAKCCLLGGCGCGLFVAGFLLIGRFALAPGFGQRSMDDTTITLESATMYQPMNDTIMMRTEITMNNVGLFPAHAGAFKANLGSNGEAFAWCDFPAMDLRANGPTDLTVVTQVHVTDVEAFRRATSRILQGSPDDWEISGQSEVQAVGTTMSLKVRKQLKLPATVLKEARAADIQISGSSATELFTTSSTSFFSSSTLQLKDLGRMVFAVHPAGDDGTIDASVQLGTVEVPNFEVLRGYNHLEHTAITMVKTAESEAHVAKFLGQFLSGREQVLYIRGPIESVAAFLNDITEQAVTVPGISQGFAAAAMASKELSLIGHLPDGSECPLLPPASNCLKGSQIYAQNLLGHGFAMKDVVFDADLQEDLSYSTTLHVAGTVNLGVTCSQGRKLVRMYSTPGMWWSDTSRGSGDATIVVPDVPAEAGKVLTSFFLAGKPQPGQSDGSSCLGTGLDCCFTTILPAAACHAQRRGSWVVPFNLDGSATVAIGDFSISLKIRQEGVPLAFGADIPHLELGPVTMNCSDFTFY